MKKGDFIKIKFTGRIKETGRIFDTNEKETAEKEGIFSERMIYAPVLSIVGENYVIKGVDESFLEHNVGDKYKINVPPEKGFGKRNPSLIKLIPMRFFKREKITPFPGMPVNIDRAIGTVRSVSGGRVIVDFNHPLAGKELIYEIAITEKITDKNEKIESLIMFHTGFVNQDFEIEISDKTLRIKIKKEMPKILKEKTAKEITNKIKEIEKVEFIETFGKE